MKISERIDHLVDILCHRNGKEFAKQAELSYTSLSMWRQNDRKPPYDALERILKAYPEVRREWLIEGKGKPLVTKRTRKRSTDEEIMKRLDEMDRRLDEVLSILQKYR